MRKFLGLAMLIAIAALALAEIRPDEEISNDGGVRLTIAAEWVAAADIAADADCQVYFYDTEVGDPANVLITYGPWIVWADKVRSIQFEAYEHPDSAYVDFTSSGNALITPIR